MGGMERQVLTLIDHLDPGEFDVVVFCPAAEGLGPFFTELKQRNARLHITGRQDLPPSAKEHGFREIWIKALGWLLRRLSIEEPEAAAGLIAAQLGWMISLRGRLARAKLDIIHFHAGRLVPLYWPLIAGRLARIPTRILTLHNAARRRARLFACLERLALKSVGSIIVPSEYVKDSLLSYRRVPPEKVAVIPHGLDLPQCDAARGRAGARSDLKLPLEVPVVGIAGRLVDTKGADLLIRAAPRVRARFPAVRFVLIGEGPEENALRRLAEAEGVSEAVVFAGYRTDARQLLPAFDILAAPSRDEGLSLAVLEAMGCGIPAVASRLGGIPSLLTDGVTGLLIPPDDFAALADALIRLLAEPEQAEAMGRAGRERVRTHFLQETMLAGTFALYRAPSRSSVESQTAGEKSV